MISFLICVDIVTGGSAKGARTAFNPLLSATICNKVHPLHMILTFILYFTFLLSLFFTFAFFLWFLVLSCSIDQQCALKYAYWTWFLLLYGLIADRVVRYCCQNGISEIRTSNNTVKKTTARPVPSAHWLEFQDDSYFV